MTGASGSEFDLAEALPLLGNTPHLLDAWLRGLPTAWTECDEGPATWNARVVVGHLCEGERSDWLPRVRHLLQHGEAVAFSPFDRFAQLLHQRPLEELLDEFTALRRRSLDELRSLRLEQTDLQRRGRHPEFGVVTLAQHLATWVAHDLTHVTQIARVMAHRLVIAVGPWRAYLRVLSDGEQARSAGPTRPATGGNP